MAHEKKCGACGAEHAARLPAAKKWLVLPLWRPKRKRGDVRLPLTSADFIAGSDGVLHMSGRFIARRAQERLANPGPGRAELAKLARRTEQWEAGQFDRGVRTFFALRRENQAGYSWADE